MRVSWYDHWPLQNLIFNQIICNKNLHNCLIMLMNWFFSRLKFRIMQQFLLIKVNTKLQGFFPLKKAFFLVFLFYCFEDWMTHFSANLSIIKNELRLFNFLHFLRNFVSHMKLITEPEINNKNCSKVVCVSNFRSPAARLCYIILWFKCTFLLTKNK